MMWAYYLWNFMGPTKVFKAGIKELFDIKYLKNCVCVI